MSTNIFITGTDTEVGKTYITAGLLKAINQTGLKTIGLKPIASDAKFDQESKALVNEDAFIIKNSASVSLPYSLVNPFCFEPPIAPHIAAHLVGVTLSIEKLEVAINLASSNSNYDLGLIEGAGGWHVPLNKTELVSDLVAKMKLPVILVVGIKLGCINHALLTSEAIKNSGCKLIGWIANCLEPNSLCKDENIFAIKSKIDAPLLGRIPHKGAVNKHIDINTVLQYI
ncbi:MAG: dethiobiotin synthetase [Francisellaceae bacterium]|jgi:dethiobiotin synthetase